MNWRRRVVNWAAVLAVPLPLAAAHNGNGPVTIATIAVYGLAAAAGSWWSEARPRGGRA